MPNYWMDNAMRPGQHVLVDCGSWPDPVTQRRFRDLRTHVAPANFQRVGNDRLVVRLPPKKASAVLAAMPEIKEGAAGYCWCTHGFAPNASLTRASATPAQSENGCSSVAVEAHVGHDNQRKAL